MLVARDPAPFISIAQIIFLAWSLFMSASYVYIISSHRNGTIYIGVTNNLIRRFWEHKNKIIKGFTAQYGVDKLVYYEEHQEICVAIQREKRLKEWPRNGKYI